LELETQRLIEGELGSMSAEHTIRLTNQTEQLAKTINALLGVPKTGDVLEKQKSQGTQRRELTPISKKPQATSY
jgi:hypothetical protein